MSNVLVAPPLYETKINKIKKSGIDHQMLISMFDFARTNAGGVRARQAALPLMDLESGNCTNWLRQ
jgi:hypothetical protein